MKKQEKLQKYQKMHRQLTIERKPLEDEYKRTLKTLQKHNKMLKAVGQAIYDLKFNGDTLHVTDHAVVRYLERVKGWDIEELRVEIANHKLAQREGNSIVTVNLEGE